MQPLPLEFTEGHYRYTQVTRQGMLAIYQQSHLQGTMTRYEVVRIREMAEHTWPRGNTTPAHEFYPNVSRWGVDAWTCFSRQEADALLATLSPVDDLTSTPHGGPCDGAANGYY